MKQTFSLKEPGDKSVFSVPEGYFAGMSGRMNKLIDRSQQQELQVIDTPVKKINLTWMDRYRPVLYLAAMFVVLLFSVSTVMNITSKHSDADNLAKKSTTDKQQENKQPSAPTAEDYLISQIGTDGIAEYYINPDLYEN
jgi:flagellar motor protein MotB